MNKTIKNTIVFTNGDSVVINEPISLPLKEKVMYKIKNSDKNAIISTSTGETVIPVNNILFATSSPFNFEEMELDGCYEIYFRSKDQYGNKRLYRIHFVWIISTAKYLFNTCLWIRLYNLFFMFRQAWSGSNKLAMHVWGIAICLFWLYPVPGNVYGRNHIDHLLFPNAEQSTIDQQAI